MWASRKVSVAERRRVEVELSVELVHSGNGRLGARAGRCATARRVARVGRALVDFPVLDLKERW